MELYIGGSGQGKKEYVQACHKNKKFIVLDEQEIDMLFLKKMEGEILIDHFHAWIKNKIKEGKNPEMLTEDLVLNYPDCVIISDEIGNGLVPMEASEREYRDRTGKILIGLAKKAERVERIICGLGQRLK